MIDGVLANTGNSRLIKANLPATYDEFKTLAANGQLPIDLLFNAAGWNTLPTFLNKLSLLKDDTSSMLDNAENVDAALALLGKYNKYWWKRRTDSIYYVPSLGTKYSDPIMRETVSSTTHTFSYSDSVDISSNGVITLHNPSTVVVSYTSYTAATILQGKYVTGWYDNSTASYNYTTVKYIDSSATFSRDTSDGYRVTCSSMALVTATIAHSYGDWTYVQATTRNYYPDTGTQAGYEYSYLGKPLENSILPVHIATGSYTGTGTYGSANPCSLTFDFAPKMLIITDYYHAATTYGYGFVFPTVGNSISSQMLTTTYTQNLGFYNGSNSGYSYGKKSSDGKTISWYNTNNAIDQKNLSGDTYYYLAIG